MAAETTQRSNHETWVLVCTVLASAMAFIDSTALNVALPKIQSQLNASGTELMWIVNSYAVVTAALILLGGALGDRFGRKGVFAVGIGWFVAASLACGFATDASTLIAARTLQGFGAALMIPGSLALISKTFDPSRRGRAIGIWSACSVVMTALGPILGGLLADAGLWRAVFFINLPIGAIAIGVLLVKVNAPQRPKESPRLDYAGAVWSVTGLAGLNFGLLEAASRGWSDPIVVVACLVGVGSLGAFVWTESRSRSPLLPLNLFRDRRFVAASQLTVCFYSGLYGMLFFLALNLIQVQHYRAAIAGAAQLPLMLMVIILSPVAGILVDRYGPRIPLTIGGTLATLGFLWLALPGVTSGSSDYWIHFFPPLMMLGVAMGISAAPLSTTIMNSVSENQLGIASGINATLARLSSVLGIAVLGPIAIATFRHSLALRSNTLSLSKEASEYLQRASWKLADTLPPKDLSLDLTAAVDQAIGLSYVDAFRVVCWISAIAVGLSTLLAAGTLVERQPVDGSHA